MAEDHKELFMAEFITLTVQKRFSTGKGANRRLRHAGIIPAVLYAPGGESLPVQAQETDLMKVFDVAGRTTVINIAVEEGGVKNSTPALIWDVDFFPTRRRMQHVDFFAVDLNRELKIRIPLEFTGTAKGTKLGGIVEAFHEYVDVIGKPLSLPNKIVIDITPLALGESLRVSDIPLPDGVRPATDPARTVLSVRDNSAIEEAEDAAAAAAE
jgi:large subunit ribosomal protein L25